MSTKHTTTRRRGGRISASAVIAGRHAALGQSVLCLKARVALLSSVIATQQRMLIAAGLAPPPEAAEIVRQERARRSAP